MNLRFERLEVSAVRGVSRAALDLGPGLNVLYGPNEAGKSTLAHALRAVLLLPVGSTERESLFPWEGGDPTVTLILRRPDGRYLRVKKDFGGERATLAESNLRDADFSEIARQRTVDERLRALLDLGVASAGRGLPNPYLVRVLLPEQTDVDALLGERLEQSVQKRVQDALGALAEDPRVKAVLAEAQRQRDRFFTATGQSRRGKQNPLAAALDAVKKSEQLFSEEREKAEAAERQAAAVGEAEAAVEAALAAESAAERRWAEVRDAFQATAKVEAAERALNDAVAAITAINAAEAERDRTSESLSRAEAERLAAKDNIAGAEEKLARAQAGLEAAQRGLDNAAGDDRIRHEQALLELAAAELGAENERQKAILGSAEAALEAEAKADAERRAAERLAETLLLAQKTREDAVRAEATAAAAERVAAARLAHSQLVSAREAAARAASDAARHEALGGELERLDAQIAEREAAVLALGAPDDAALDELRRLARRVETARAKLELGLAVEVEAKSDVPIRIQADGAAATGPAVEARREATVDVGDFATVRIRVGRPGDRRELESAEAAAAEHLLPALARARVTDIVGLEAKTREAREAREAVKLDRQRRDGIAEARAQLGAASAASAEREREAEQLEARLLSHFPELGPDPERFFASAPDPKTVDLEAARAARLDAERSLSSAEAQATEGVRRAEAAAEQAQARAEPLGAPPAVVAERARAAMEQAEATLRDTRAKLSNLVQETKLAREMAQEALLAAQAEAERARAERAAAAEAGERLAALAAQLRGRCEEQTHRLEQLDRAAAEGLQAERRRALEVLLPLPRRVDRAELDEAEQALAAASAARADRERAAERVRGALEAAGGLVAEERKQAAQEAVDRAREELEALELEASAAKCLLEVLEEARREVTQHVGVKLAGPLGARFAELTGSQRAVKLSPALEASGVEVLGQLRSRTSLSVGAREQLATLLRLLLAEQLQAPVVLDDHLVQADPTRLEWFRRALRTTAQRTQVLVFTCRPADYLDGALPTEATADLAGGLIRLHDLSRLIERTQT